MTALTRWSVALVLATLYLPPAAAQNAPDGSRPGAVYNPCADLVAEAVAAARDEDLAAAEIALTAASALCPADPAVLLELAALRFRQERFVEAARLAEQVVAARPEHGFAWELLASSRFLVDDGAGALRAWNRVYRPVNQRTRVAGARRTPDATVMAAVGIPSGDLITPANLLRARRRVGALPTAWLARVDYRPMAGGRAEVEAVLAERPVLGRSLPDLLQHGVRAAVDARLRLDVAGPLGTGELWTGEWRWQRNRRSLGVGLVTAGMPLGPSVLELHAARRASAYAVPAPGSDGAETLRESRRTAGLTVSDWASGSLMWQVGGSVDRWQDRGTFVGMAAALDLRSPGDGAAARIDAGSWWSPSEQDRFRTARLQVVARTGTSAAAGFEWTARAGLARSSAAAPRDLWSGAGTGRASGALLRAHPLLDGEGVVRGRFFGPELAHGSAELRRWLNAVGPVRIGAAAFLDAAAVQALRPERDTHTALDAGVGIRLDVPGLAGPLRADLARGLTDGATAVSVGWFSAWPGWW